MADFCGSTEDLCVRRGDSPIIPIVVRDDQLAVVNISGYTFLMTVDPSPAPASDVNNLFQVAGVITDAANGRLTFQPSTVNTDQSPGVYFYDIQMITTASSKRTILSGQFEIKQDITKD